MRRSRSESPGRFVSTHNGNSSRRCDCLRPSFHLRQKSGAELNLTVGDGHFTDPDGNDLDYTVTVNGGSAPAWLTFDTETGLLTGTPTAAQAGSFEVSVIAGDGSLSSTADVLNLIIARPDPRGTRGNDRLVGDVGDDIMNGRRGNDRLIGGDGADTFALSKGHDRVIDFDPAEGDIIDLSHAKGIKNFNDLMNHRIEDSNSLNDLASDMFIF